MKSRKKIESLLLAGTLSFLLQIVTAFGASSTEYVPGDFRTWSGFQDNVSFSWSSRDNRVITGEEGWEHFDRCTRYTGADSYYTLDTWAFKREWGIDSFTENMWADSEDTWYLGYNTRSDRYTYTDGPRYLVQLPNMKYLGHTDSREYLAYLPHGSTVSGRFSVVVHGKYDIWNCGGTSEDGTWVTAPRSSNRTATDAVVNQKLTIVFTITSSGSDSSRRFRIKVLPLCVGDKWLHGDGYHYQICTECGAECMKESCKDTDNDGLCDVCGFDMHTHTWQDVWHSYYDGSVTTPNAYKTRKCSSCGEEDNKEVWSTYNATVNFKVRVPDGETWALGKTGDIIETATIPIRRGHTVYSWLNAYPSESGNETIQNLNGVTVLYKYAPATYKECGICDYEIDSSAMDNDRKSNITTTVWCEPSKVYFTLKFTDAADSTSIGERRNYRFLPGNTVGYSDFRIPGDVWTYRNKKYRISNVSEKFTVPKTGSVTVTRKLTAVSYSISSTMNYPDGTVSELGTRYDYWIPIGTPFTKNNVNLSGEDGTKYVVDRISPTSTSEPGTRVQIYLKYRPYTITYITRDQADNKELARTTKQILWGSSTRGNIIGTADVTYNGIPYAYVSDTQIAKITGDATVYRYMKKKQYDLTFNANTGTGTMQKVTYLYGQNYDLPASKFSKVGYTQQGWSKQSTGTKQYNLGQSVRDIGNCTLYAIWKANSYTLSYDPRYARAESNKTVVFDSPYGTLPAPSQRGYTFQGWYLNNQRIISTTIVRTPNNHLLRSKWSEVLRNVVFTSDTKSATVQVIEGQKVSPPFTPMKRGYKFLHWSISPGGGEFDFNNTISDNTTFYAVFEGNKVHVDLCGTDKVYDYPATLGELPPVPSVPGKEGLGWSWDPEGTKPAKPTDQVPDHDFTLYPQYSSIIYTITLPEIGEVEIKYMEQIPHLPTPEKLGYKFNGWKYGEIVVKGGDPFIWLEDIELTPSWEKITHIVVFPDGSTKELDEGDKIGEIPKVPEKPGYETDGWVDQDGNKVDENTEVHGDIIIELLYKPKEYTLTLVDGDWSDTVKVEGGRKIYDLPEREKDGYVFVGWSMSDSGKPTSGPFYADQNLYAKYKPEKQPIDLGNGDIIYRDTGDSVGNLPKPPKDNAVFDHWEDSAGNIVDRDTKVPPGGLDLHPVYMDKPTTGGDGNGSGNNGGSGNGDDGTGGTGGSGFGASETVVIRYWSGDVRINTVDHPKGDVLYDPGPPSLKDVETKSFLYWTDLSGKKYVFGSTVSSDIDLYAEWVD